MYISGTISNLQSRMHQLPANTGDVSQFITESKNHIALGKINIPMSGNLEREIQNRKYSITKQSSDLTTKHLK